MNYTFSALSNEICQGWRSGEMDANGQPPERAISDGGGIPCRSCLQDIAAGQEMLVLAHRPFGILNPYAEVGPIFICAKCDRRDDAQALPPVLTTRERHLLKGYSADDRIVYGTGAIVETDDIPAFILQTFANPDIAYIDVRSATNNCFTVRIKRHNC